MISEGCCSQLGIPHRLGEIDIDPILDKLREGTPGLELSPEPQWFMPPLVKAAQVLSSFELDSECPFSWDQLSYPVLPVDATLREQLRHSFSDVSDFLFSLLLLLFMHIYTSLIPLLSLWQVQSKKNSFPDPCHYSLCHNC